MAKQIGIILLCALLGYTHAQNAVLGDYPAHVGVHIGVGNTRFGEGVILNENHVLTLADNVVDPVTRVLYSPGYIDVTAGVVSIGANVPNSLAVDRIYIHDQYNFHTGEYNVAILRMTNNFVFDTNAIRPNIAPVTFNNRIVQDGTNCQLVGWNNAPNTLITPLQSAAAPIMSRSTCNLLNNPAIQGNVRDQHICAGQLGVNAAICNNNNGAGLYCDGQLVGLRTLGRECNVANSPAVLIQTRWFQDWIQQTIASDRPQGGNQRLATIGEYPSHVILRMTDGRRGEGVILNANHVLTVATNVFEQEERNFRLGPENITVVAGVSVPANPAAAAILAVFRIYAHPMYNFHSDKFNVAVLRMQFNIPNLELAPTAFAVIHSRIVPESRICQLVGFNDVAVGNVVTQVLQIADKPVMSRVTCNAVQNSNIQGHVGDQHICVADTATGHCGYLDGAALYCDGEVVGLRTRGLACDNYASSPGVLVQSRWFQDWIPQQFTRTDNPPAGPVTAPGVEGPNDSGTMVILSTVALVFAVAVNLFI